MEERLIQIKESNLFKFTQDMIAAIREDLRASMETEYVSKEVALKMLVDVKETTLWRLSSGKNKVIGTTNVGKTVGYKRQDIIDFLDQNAKPRNKQIK